MVLSWVTLLKSLSKIALPIIFRVTYSANTLLHIHSLFFFCQRIIKRIFTRSPIIPTIRFEHLFVETPLQERVIELTIQWNYREVHFPQPSSAKVRTRNRFLSSRFEQQFRNEHQTCVSWDSSDVWLLLFLRPLAISVTSLPNRPCPCPIMCSRIYIGQQIFAIMCHRYIASHLSPWMDHSSTRNALGLGTDRPIGQPTTRVKIRSDRSLV